MKLLLLLLLSLLFVPLFQGHPPTKSYIVVLKESADVDNVSRRFSPKHKYKHALKGFAAELTTAERDSLAGDSAVAYIEPDGIATIQQTSQVTPPGIARISAPQHPYFGSAADVDIAIIDTGIVTHPDLNLYADFEACCTGTTRNGHATHVAGIAAALNNDFGVVGVAPGARLWSVRVLDAGGGGQWSSVIAGLDYVAANAAEIEVVNLSLGSIGYILTVHIAVRACVNAGVVVVVAAGNSGRDVYGPDGNFGTSDDFIPASFPEVAAISAMIDTDGLAGGLGIPASYGADDTFASFTNFSASLRRPNDMNSPGAAISLAAPGVNVLSTLPPDTYGTLSGTSMSAPHVAGSVALYIEQYGRAFDADGVYTIRQAMIRAGQPQRLWLPGGNTNDRDKKHEPLVNNSVN